MLDDAVLELARSGDEAAFAQIVGQFGRELHVHCYRMLGSFDDADDAVQEALVAAWRGVGTFGGRSSLRTWLYRIATNTCLNALRSASRRHPAARALPGAGASAEVTWLQPYPDALLDELPAPDAGPESTVELGETVSLAFTCALQLLSPRARAVLILRDVLDFTGHETAGMLGSTDDAVAMTLSRARATLRSWQASPREMIPNAAVRLLATELASALAERDIDAVVRLLAKDVRLSMPPAPAVWVGLRQARDFLATVAFRAVPEGRFIQASANRQPALAVYARDAASGAWRAGGLLVITPRVTPGGAEIAALTRFGSHALRPFGLPAILHEADS